MIPWTESCLHRLRQWTSRTEWGRRILGLREGSNEVDAHHGLLMLQIDGLSQEHLEQVISAGRMPHLQSLLEKEDYQLHTQYSGQPASTPAVQGELFYGVRCATPAFHFVDHLTGQFRTMYRQKDAREVEERLQQKGGDPLLRGGASYSNVYRGGASETNAHFCAASKGWGHSPSLLRMAALLALNPWSLIRVVTLLLIEFALALCDVVRGGIFGRYQLWQELRYIPYRVFIGILLRELIVISARIDLARGLPIIHANLLGYDEQAHRRGPGSRFAHWSLRGIDEAIARLSKGASSSPQRHYDVWIYSDHGQVRVTPYPQIAGHGIEEAVAKAAREPASINPLDSGRTRARRDLIFQDNKDADRKRGFEADDQTGIQVAAMGPIGLVTFESAPTLTALEATARKLAEDEAIPLVLHLGTDEDITAYDGNGSHRFPDEAAEVLGRDHPFLNEVAEDLAELVRHPDAGHLVLCGYRHGKKPISFAIENGSHCGPSPEETRAFALLPRDTTLPTRTGDHLRPIDLRHAALHVLGREIITEPFYLKLEKRGDSRPLRIMTYNVHRCTGTDGVVSPARIARVIARHAPDVVALQELDVGRLRTGETDQAAEIARHLEMDVHFHPAIHLEEERYGDAILTHLPMDLVSAALLPSSGPSPEPRGALWVRIKHEGRWINVINTHLGLSPWERRVQVEALLGEAWLGHPDCADPVVLCGDFNLLPVSALYRDLSRHLENAQDLVGGLPQASFPASRPLLRIDHLFSSRDLTPEAVEVPSDELARTASDHRPLVADFASTLGADSRSPIHLARTRIL